MAIILLSQLNQKALARLAAKYQINTFYLFGSRAKGEETKTSDYDFAIIFKETVKSEEYDQLQVKIISELLPLVSARFIDLVILNNNRIPLRLKYNIIKEGKIIYEKDKSLRIELETRTMTLWFDWQYFENMWSEIYLKRMARGKF
jgi:hypothetical protein